MLVLKNYYELVIKYDFINKFLYENLEEIPKIKKINLNFGYNNNSLNLKNLAIAILSLELITKQKGELTHLKNTKLSIKIRKGYPVGCKITLRKTAMYEFFFKLLTEVLPQIKNFYGIKVKRSQINSISFKLINAILFNELERHHGLFKTLPILDITIITNTKNQEELLFLINSHKLPLLTPTKE